jgi:hypothetical protein
VSAKKVEFPDEPRISNEAKKFISGCLEYHQETRLTVN